MTSNKAAESGFMTEIFAENRVCIRNHIGVLVLDEAEENEAIPSTWPSPGKFYGAMTSLPY